MYRLLLLLVVSAVTTSCLAASHPELRGEHPDQDDIDDGQCVPIKCDLGVPPQQCTTLCALRHYLPVCQPPGDFCLCQRLLGGREELLSPDEVLDQPEYGVLNIFAFIVPLGTFYQEDVEPKALELETLEPSPELYVVNVHEGRLYWLFRYVLTGLFVLMVALVVYEIIMCRSNSYDKFVPEDLMGWKTSGPA